MAQQHGQGGRGGQGDGRGGHGGRRNPEGPRGSGSRRNPGELARGNRQRSGDGQPRGHRQTRGHGQTRTRSRSESVRPRTPREVALTVLREVETEDAYANLLLPGRIRNAEMSPRDSSLATELTYGTLRMQGLYDRIVLTAAERDPADLDPLTRQAVRMGAHQLLGMRVRDHAAVSETVDALRALGGGRAAGLANALLRRVSERSREEWLAVLTADVPETEALSLAHSHPAWIVRALGQALRGHKRADARTGGLESVLAADNAPAKVTLAALPGLADAEELALTAGHRGALSPLAVVLDGGDPRDVPGVDAARVRVQDEGSQLIALALAQASAAEHPRWLDLCAGPGGKTAVLAALAAQRGGRVEAVDASAHRAELVRDSVRASADVVDIARADGRAFAADRPERFDGVLVDAPCTGLGALRRRPEARWRRRPEDVAALAEVQLGLLDAALTACAPGGVVAYSTCSPHWAETGSIVDEVLAGRRDAEVLDAAAVLAEVTGAEADSFASAVRGEGRFVQLWPDVHGTDGMFLALIRRR
ncbi:RsmB/NOP family class I SAM-dependent RNA methyltransferase [Brevibacterium album]|uniref:RsmB/NOP family class I SAM-dependent RNA methyltransferase n=1 Tax=Brevibacterium album TaxID=417948 RepID=UPI00040FCE4E|nr:transcription antitermination factor NusB [Brevibacterium album]